jgi:hypothetical protein
MTRDKKCMPIENIPLNQGSQDLGPLVRKNILKKLRLGPATLS